MLHLQQDIIRLDISMQHPMLMGMLNGIGQTSNNHHRPLHRRMFAFEQIAQTFSIDELRDLIRNSVNIARLQNTHDAGVVEHCSRPTFSEKPIVQFLRLEDRSQRHLDCHLSSQYRIFGKKDNTKAARAKSPDDAKSTDLVRDSRLLMSGCVVCPGGCFSATILFQQLEAILNFIKPALQLGIGQAGKERKVCVAIDDESEAVARASSN